MNFAETLRPTSENLWSAAIETLPENLKSNINFAQSSKHKSLDELLEATNEARKRFIDKSWSFKRKSGEVVIFRDVLAKAARWLDNFKQVGDILASIDPLHAAPPWAGVRFLLIVATGDLKAYSSLLEATIHIAEMIYRGALVEKLLSNSRSEAAAELRRVLIKLYAAILAYLSEECAYYDENGFKRVSKHGISSPTKFEEAMTTINEGQKDVDRCINLFGVQSQLNCAAEVERRLKDSYDLMRHSDDRVIEYLEQHDKHRRAEILCWISEQPYEKHHIEAKKEVLEGTGTWLLDEVIFIRWMNESASSILWLYGIPGSGKSKLTSVVIKNALEQFKRKQTSALGYFYCSRNPAEPGRSDAASIVASIARQLSTAEYEGPLLEATIEMYTAKEKNGFASGSLSLEDSISLILKLLERYEDATIVIDALDECNEETRGDLLDTLEELLKESPCLLKLFVSSRTDQNIVYRLETYPNLELSSGRNAKDINLYARSETKRLIKRGDLMRRSQRKEELCDKIINELISKADGMFRWVSLQLQTLCKLATDVAIEERLGRLPKTLAELYQDILNTINYQESDADRQFAQNAFSWLLCARVQLKTEDFLAAVSITRHGSGSPIEKGQILQICSNLIVFDSTANTFRFAHLTVREFFEDQEAYKLAATNALAAEACLLNLITVSPETSLQEPFLWYSCLFWAEHVKEVTWQPQSNLHDNVCKFLADEHEQSCFYFWYMNVKELRWGEHRHKIPHRLEASISSVPQVLLVVCAYDLCGVLCSTRWKQLAQESPKNLEAETHHTISVRYGNGDILKWQLEIRLLPKATEEDILGAAHNDVNGENVMAVLLDNGGTDIAITEDMAIAASKNDKSGKRVMALLLSRAPAKAHHITEGAAVLIINHFGPAIVEQLLRKSTPELQITEDIIVAAARNEDYGTDLLKLLSKEGEKKIAITEKVITSAVRNSGSGLEILKLLVKIIPGGKIPVTENAMYAALAEGGYGEKTNWDLILLLYAHSDADVVFSNTTFVDIMSATWLAMDPDLVDFFLAKVGSKILTTPSVIEECIRACTPDVLERLFKTSVATVQITKNMVQAARTSVCCDETLRLLLEKGKIEPAVMQDLATALLRTFSPEEFQMLLTRREVELHITENVIEAVAANYDFSEELIKILIEKWGGDLPINGMAVRHFLLPAFVTSHTRQFNGEGHLREGLCRVEPRREGLVLLVENNKARTSLTEEALEQMVRCHDKDIIEKVLVKWGDEIMLTTGLVAMDCYLSRMGCTTTIAMFLQHCTVPTTKVKYILSHMLGYCNVSTLRKFLTKTGATVRTNEKIVKAISKNFHAEEVLVMLLNDHEIKSPVTEELVISICRRFSTRIFRLFVKRVGRGLQITEDIAVAMIKNLEYGESILAMIQRRGIMAIPMTEKVIEAAARWGDVMLMNRLLDMWDKGVMATDGAIRAVSEGHGNEDDTMTLLPDGQSTGALITDAVIYATRHNDQHGHEILLLLLEIDDATYSITESVMKIAARDFFLAEFKNLLVNRNPGAFVTEGLVEGVLSGYKSTAEKLTLLFDEAGDQIPITERIIQKAIKNEGIGVKKLGLLIDKCGAKISITEDMIKDAVTQESASVEKLRLLLDKGGSQIPFTEKLVEEAIENNPIHDIVRCLYYCESRGMGRVVDEDVNVEKLQLLLDKGDPQIPVTEQVIKTAIRCGFRGRYFLRTIICQGRTDITITRAAFEYAAEFAPGDNELTDLLLQFPCVPQEELPRPKGILKRFPWPTNCRKKFSSPRRNARNKRRRAAKYRKGTRSRHRKMLRAKERDSKAQARSTLVWGSPWRNRLLSCIFFVVLCLVLGYLRWFPF